jgi:hypothetical protein
MDSDVLTYLVNQQVVYDLGMFLLVLLVNDNNAVKSEILDYYKDEVNSYCNKISKNQMHIIEFESDRIWNPVDEQKRRKIGTMNLRMG